MVELQSSKLATRVRFPSPAPFIINGLRSSAVKRVGRMSFFDRQYEVFAMFGEPKAEPAWSEQKWGRIVDILDPLVRKTRDRAAVRSTQLSIGAGSPNQRAISFGRIGWNAQGHKKWVHTATTGDRAEFISTEVWAPSWTTCEREGLAPDIYLAVRNEQSVPRDQVAFNSIFIFALALDQDIQIVSRGRPSAEALATLLGALLRVRCVRPWGYRRGDVGFTGAIGDLYVTGLVKPGSRNQQPLTSDILIGNWEAF
jgi:hypothetical protein